jgi:fused signal recognition particle receptor
VAAKASPGAPQGVLLVLDSTTGQNGLAQAKAFAEAVGVTGIVLTKLDGSSKGGVAFAIRSELKLPIVYAGLGETVDDLVAFDPVAFVDGLLPKA